MLVVDDLPVIRTLLNEQFSLAGMDCTVCASGEEALEKMRQAYEQKRPYDLAVIDYVMEGMNGDDLAEKIKADPDLEKTCLVMLTAAGNPIHRHSFINRGFSAYIPKPFKNEELVQMLAKIWTGYKNSNEGDWISLPDQNAADSEISAEEILKGRDILLVEDSRLNQAYATEVLEGRGARVTTAIHGQEAIEILTENSDFDIILMDCQMPILDGFETTKTIRKMEQRKKLAEGLPIIALTANAMKGDRQKCLDAGMDDYLAKPVRSDDLIDMVVKYACGSHLNFQKDNVVSINRPPLQKNQTFDAEVLKEIMMTFGAQFEDVCNIFIEDTQAYIDQISTAVQKGDGQAAILPAHTIKSTARRMGVMRLAAMAEKLEAMMREDKTYPDKRLAAMIRDIEHQFEKIKSILKLELEQAAGRRT